MIKLPTPLAQLRDAAIENESQLCQCAGPCCYGCEDKVKSLVTVGFDACADHLLPLLQECREAMSMGAFHHNACPWLNGKECCCANEKVKHALVKLDAALGGPSEQDRVGFDGEGEG